MRFSADAYQTTFCPPVLQVTLWGEFTTNPGDAIEAAVRAGNHPVLAVKAGRIGDFNGKNISSVSSTIVSEQGVCKGPVALSSSCAAVSCQQCTVLHFQLKAIVTAAGWRPSDWLEASFSIRCRCY